MTAETALDEALQADIEDGMEDYLAERRLSDGGYHPPEVVLNAYRRDQLPELDADALRNHLAVCPNCTDQYLDLVEAQRWRKGLALCGIGAGVLLVLGTVLSALLEADDVREPFPYDDDPD